MSTTSTTSTATSTPISGSTIPTTGAYRRRRLDRPGLRLCHPEVREHHMEFVRELLERYDPDGLELDWMRFGYHFKPGHEAEGRAILTQFMRDVRALTREWSRNAATRSSSAPACPPRPNPPMGLAWTPSLGEGRPDRHARPDAVLGHAPISTSPSNNGEKTWAWLQPPAQL